MWNSLMVTVLSYRYVVDFSETYMQWRLLQDILAALLAITRISFVNVMAGGWLLGTSFLSNPVVIARYILWNSICFASLGVFCSTTPQSIAAHQSSRYFLLPSIPY